MLKIATVGIIATLMLVGGGVQLARIELIQGEKLRTRAQRQQTSTWTIPALRGEIWDAQGRVLAGTLRRPSIFVDPFCISNPSFAAHSLAPFVGRPAAELEQILVEQKDKRFVWLARRAPTDDFDGFVQRFESLCRARGLRGFGVQAEGFRVYPQGAVAPHVLGFVGIDLQGLAGIEQEYDKILTGTPGQQAATVDAIRRRLRSENYVPPEDGATIVLTLDTYLQQFVQTKVRAAQQKHAATWVSALVMDPYSGEILAIATAPDFDPANPVPEGYEKLSPKRQEVAAEVWRNRVIADAFEPGSIFKPFIASLALEDKLTRLDEVFNIQGPVHSFAGRMIRDTHAYDVLTLHQVISKSSNIGMGMLGARCGMKRLHDYLEKFGFGSPTGIDLPGESAGIVRPLDSWNPRYSAQSIPIGQEVSVTQVQLLSAFCAFCNGGKLMRPRIVRGIIGVDGQTIEDHSEPIVVRQVLSPATSEAFRLQALVETVREGTGKQAALDDYQVFGKTGTAQIARRDGRGYESNAYVGSFIGGAPASWPRVAVLVSIYRPTKEGYYGGVVAAPVVKEIIAEVLNYMRVPPEIEDADRPRRLAPAAGDDLGD